ncbi:hypothetical protein D3C86_2032150 [compost metagenome]
MNFFTQTTDFLNAFLTKRGVHQKSQSRLSLPEVVRSVVEVLFNKLTNEAELLHLTQLEVGHIAFIHFTGGDGDDFGIVL